MSVKCSESGLRYPGAQDGLVDSLINLSHNTTLAPPSTAHTTVDMEKGARAGGVSAVAFIHAIYYTCA